MRMSPDGIVGSDWARALTAARALIRSRRTRDTLLPTRWGGIMRKIMGTAPRKVGALVSMGAFVRRSFGVADSSAGIVCRTDIQCQEISDSRHRSDLGNRQAMRDLRDPCDSSNPIRSFTGSAERIGLKAHSEIKFRSVLDSASCLDAFVVETATIYS